MRRQANEDTYIKTHKHSDAQADERGYIDLGMVHLRCVCVCLAVQAYGRVMEADNVELERLKTMQNNMR